MKPIRLFFRFSLITFALLVIIIYVFNLDYLLNGVSKTYLKGYSGPNIYDESYFESAAVKGSDNPSDPFLRSEFTKTSLKDTAFHNSIGTDFMFIAYQDTVLLEYENLNRLSDRSNSFSMAKSMVALCAAKSIELGTIPSWQTPINLYDSADAFDATIANQGIGNFLSMSSGLDWIESGKNPFSDNAKAYYGSDLNQLVIGKKANTNEIGKYIYKSGNTQIAAMALESANQNSLADFFNEHFWEKIGCNSASWGTDSKNNEKAYCCLYAKGIDYAKIGKLLLNKGVYSGKQVISPDILSQMIKPYVKYRMDGELNDCYGIGFWLLKYKGKSLFYARGILGQYIIMIPEENLLIVRLGEKRLDTDAKMHPMDIYHYLDNAFELKSEYEKRY